MKRIALILCAACLCFGCASGPSGGGSNTQREPSLYVSAKGNDKNNGLSESRPLKTLKKALAVGADEGIRKITVLGTLDSKSEGEPIVLKDQNQRGEYLITGKPGESGAKRAVLSGKGAIYSDAVTVDGATIRFEHIEISGGQELIVVWRTRGAGIQIIDKATVILGPGAVVKDNTRIGVSVYDHSGLILEGGDIRDNSDSGVKLTSYSSLTMNSGTIRNNKNAGVEIMGDYFTMNGGTISGNEKMGVYVGGTFTLAGGTISGHKGNGVLVRKEGTFVMTGGTITGNTHPTVNGVGVYVFAGGRFDQTGGSIANNTTGTTNDRDSNLYREKGALGSGDLAIREREAEPIIARTTAAINRNPRDAQALFDRGVAYSSIGHGKKAAEDFQKVQEINPRIEGNYSEGRIATSLALYAILGSSSDIFDDDMKWWYKENFRDDPRVSGW